MKQDDAHDDEGYDGVIIPFPDRKDEQTGLGPFCDKCRGHRYARNEGRGKCGHQVFFTGIHYCGRCAILKQICRSCGSDIAVVFRRLEEEREQRGRRGGRDKREKSRMKILKK